MKPTLLRGWAVQANFSQPLPLAEAISKLGFVQADPIRSPARAQDLILRQRVPGYRAGDLDAQYPHLDIEEDFLYAYGFLPPATWRLLHPKQRPKLTALERRVHELVLELGDVHPSSLEAHLGATRAVNAWGGYSNATTRALDHLHWCGLLRVARREKGIRVYMPARSNEDVEASEAERLRRLVMLVAGIFAPVPEPTLRQLLSHLNYSLTPPAKTRPILAELLTSGKLEQAMVDGVNYVWPAGSFAASSNEPPPPRVRILAPFDPLVWDRRRFEHLWGWPYRFEAYTPAPKRKLGYYAMPLLWRDQVIGWANAAVAEGKLTVEAGFTKRRPSGRDFKLAYEEEVASLASALPVTEP